MTGTLGVVGTAVVGRIGTSAYFLVKVGRRFAHELRLLHSKPVMAGRRIERKTEIGRAHV